ncbi:carbohydrate kinase [Inquilinus sp. KBS0705]|nr:carbohydrate kinase [Inquilinus sp. KBS0705]
MSKKPVVAIFDAGKTNKKLFLFDEQYRIVFERTARFAEITDEDGFACENVDALKLAVLDALHEVGALDEFEVKAINFSAYGASFVYVDEKGEPVTPLYNYLKPYPPQLQKQFYDTYGGELEFAHATASPVLDSLNSGMQLYRLKYEKPDEFNRIKYALHLPQYLSYVVTGKAVTDITSIGCHTNLWDFTKNDYHHWVKAEGVLPKLPVITPVSQVYKAQKGIKGCATGIGMHDSSAALMPYLVNFNEPFMLLSTGTWCISLNPFNQQPLTTADLAADCLNYIQYNGKSVKASRLFTGYEHEQQAKRIAVQFGQSPATYRNMAYNASLMKNLPKIDKDKEFESIDLAIYKSGEQAYHGLIQHLVKKQYQSSMLVIADTGIKRIFVDGGFSKNKVFMNLLAAAFPGIEVYAASMAQASALGAALVIHDTWNKQSLPNDLIKLKYYSSKRLVKL